ncbi:MAG: enoyl-CoA hydratase/isomerase family protein [Pseudomonadota bacterium]
MANSKKSNVPELLIEQKSGLLSLTLNRPDSANALSPELTEALIDAITQARDVRLCTFRGEGRHFCAGFDLSDIESLSDGDLLWRFLRIETLLQAIHHAPFPTLAFAQGQVVGAGADLFAACWQRFAAPDFKIRMPGWNFELALGTRRLTNLIGCDKARDLLIDTRILDADRALQWGLVTDIVDPEAWPSRQAEIFQRADTLTTEAVQQMFRITRQDTRTEDIADIVHSAGRPGLKERIMAYRKKVQSAKKG